MMLIAGLGNPGPGYRGHRHNIGFCILDHIASSYSLSGWRARFSGLTSDGRVDAHKCILLKPQTFYNESGRSIGEAARYFDLDAEDIVVFHDDIDLAPGKIRLKQGGGHAGNNGVRSIFAHLGPAVWRVRIGVGHPGERDRVNDHVLSDFAAGDRLWRDALLTALSDAFPFLAAGDHIRFQSEVMRLAPPPGAPVTPGMEDE